jgi:hypothetical protein
MSSILGAHCASVKYVLVQMPQAQPWVQILSGHLGNARVLLQGNDFSSHRVRARPGLLLQKENLQFRQNFRGAIFLLEDPRGYVTNNGMLSLY